MRITGVDGAEAWQTCRRRLDAKAGAGGPLSRAQWGPRGGSGAWCGAGTTGARGDHPSDAEDLNWGCDPAGDIQGDPFDQTWLATMVGVFAIYWCI